MLARLLEERDVLSVVELARAMHEEAPVYRDFAFVDEKVAQLCANCLEREDWLCIVTEADDGMIVGFTAAVCVPTLFGEDAFVEDLGFYVHPAWRGTTAAVRMLRMLESWAAAMNASAIRMGVTTGTNPAQTGKFLQRFHYDLTGWLYTKPIGPLPERLG